MTARPRVYVSYARAPERGESPDGQVVASLRAALEAAGFEFCRDETHLAYSESLTGFMREIGAADRVVLVLSDAYFKSSYCMFELAEVEKNQAFRQRVHPIVLSDARIYDPVDRIEYLGFWEDKRTELTKKLASIDPAYAKNLHADLDRYADYRRMMDGVLTLLAGMNSLTWDIHVESDFAQLITRLQSSVGHTPAGDVATTPPPITRNRKPDSLFMQELAKDLRRHLDNLPELAKAALEALLDLTIPGSNNARAWHDDPSLPITSVLAPATRRFLADESPDGKVFKGHWAQAKKLLG